MSCSAERHRDPIGKRHRVGQSSAIEGASTPAAEPRRNMGNVVVLAIESAERLFWRRYPREVALSFFDGRVLCWLVRPEHEWLGQDGVTGAPTPCLRPGGGADPATVAEELANAVNDYCVCADVPAVATWWITALFGACGRAAPFEILPLSEALSWSKLSPDIIEATRITVCDIYPAGTRSAAAAVTGTETLRSLCYHLAVPHIREEREARVTGLADKAADSKLDEEPIGLRGSAKPERK